MVTIEISWFTCVMIIVINNLQSQLFICPVITRKIISNNFHIVKIVTTTVINTDCEEQCDFQGLNAIIIITIITDALHKCVELRVGIIF